MLTFLKNIFEVVTNIPLYILYAVETVGNLFFAAIQAIFTVFTKLIPLPAEPAVPEFIAAINWFFPVGAVISIMLTMMSGYVIFLALRWFFKWTGNL